VFNNINFSGGYVTEIGIETFFGTVTKEISKKREIPCSLLKVNGVM